MKYFIPMILLIGVVILMGGAGGDGFRTARSVLFVIGVLLMLAVVFAYIVQRAI